MQGSPKPLLKRTALGAAALTLAFSGLIGVRFAFGSLSGGYQPTPIAAPQGKFPALPAPDTKGMSDKQVKLVEHGRYLTAAADCMPCHSGPGQKPFSGGFSFATPFGVLYSPNISPDKQQGIGNWSEKQFWAALHGGISPGSSLLVFPNYMYPAMPFTSYTKLSRHDVDAIFAYLKAVPAVHHQPPANKLKFPFNIRAGLLSWRIVNFSAGPIHYKKSWSPAVRNGAYIAKALGHCSACHTPRNFMFAEKSGHSLAGARIMNQPWYAPNISSSKKYGVGGWKRSTLVSYLHGGGNMEQGAAFGPMQKVVDDSLSQLPKKDIDDLAAYLQTATAPRDKGPVPGKASKSSIAQGKTLYTQNCALCHGEKGEGVKDVFPNLAGNQSAWNGPPDNIIGIVLGGMEPWHANGPGMPAFGSKLNDRQIADIANYVRTAWGNPGQADATPKHVLAMRETSPPHQVAVADSDYLDLPPIASAAARRFGCPMEAGMIGRLSPGSGWLHIMQGADDGAIANRTRMLVHALKKDDPNISDEQIVDMAMTAYCPVVAAKNGMSMSAKKQALAAFRESVHRMLSNGGKQAASGGGASGS